MRPNQIPVKKILGTLLILQLVFSAAAQEEWTLQRCIEYAQDKNISIKRNDLQADGMQNAYKTAKAARLPSFSGWATHNLSSGKTVNFEDYSYINTEYQDGNVGVRGDIPLFAGLAVANTIKQQKWAFQAAIKASEELRNSIAIQITSAYLYVLFAEELEKIANEQYQLSLKQVQNTEIYVEHGTMAKSNLLEMKAQAARDNYALVQAQNQVINAKLDLTQLMNLESAENFNVVQPLAADVDLESLPSPNDVYQTAVSALPQIKNAEFQAKSSEYGLASAKGRISPNLGINGMFYSRYSELGVNPLNPSAPYSYGEQLADNSYGRVSINLNIPIYNQRQTLHNINQAKIVSLDANFALDEAKIQLKQDIQRAYTDARNAYSKYKSAEEALASIEESHQYIKAKYESGLSTSLDFNISKSQLAKTKSDQLQAKYEFLLRSKILFFYHGLPISI